MYTKVIVSRKGSVTQCRHEEKYYYIILNFKMNQNKAKMMNLLLVACRKVYFANLEIKLQF